MATQTQSEDMIFVLDTSSSMFRNDSGVSNRITQSIMAIQQIIDKKIKIDSKDRYAIITFAREPKSMANMVFSSAEVLAFLQENAEFAGNTALGEAMSEAVQLVLKQMRFIGQKLCRVLIISDGLAQASAINPMNVAKIAMQLGIIIDVIRFGPAQIPGNLLKKLTELTQGDYIYVASPAELPLAIDKISKKKEKKHATLFDKSDDTDVMAQEMLGEIADLPLRLEDMTEEQKEQALYKLEKGKNITCTICYSNNCMIGKTSFMGCGRFCPNCLTPFHLHCAKMWSEQQSNKKGASKPAHNSTKLFRCPHCFYLLRIPTSDVERLGKEGRINENVQFKQVSLASFPGDNFICNAEDCGIIMNKQTEGQVYQCTSCDSHFHIDCGQKILQKERRCPYCEKIVSAQ